MTIAPIQTFGLGDIIFEQTVVRKIAKNSPILWGVEKHFCEGLSRAYPDISFIDKERLNIDYLSKEDRIEDGVRYIPFRFADQILKVPYSRCMASKYEIFNMDCSTWKQQAMWTRDRQKEQALFDLLGLKEGQEYTLVNRFFGTQSQLVAPIAEKGVEMCTIEGYSLMDWAKIIEQASVIRTVSTSLFYLLELLNLQAKEIHLYPRKPIETDFRNIDYLFTKNYILHV